MHDATAHPGPTAPASAAARFVGYVMAGTTLVAAADLAARGAGRRRPRPSGPQIAELYDLNDFITDACAADRQPDHRRGPRATARRTSRCRARRSARASRPRRR